MDKYYKNLCEVTDVMGYISRIDNYDMLDVSDYLLKCLGITEDGYKGKKCHEVIHGKNTPCVFCNNSRLKLGEYDKWYAYNPLLDAHLAVRDTLIEHEEFGKVRMEVCYEVTIEVNSVKELQTRESRDKAIGECAKILLNSNGVQSIKDILKIINGFFGAEYSLIIEYNDTTANITHEYPHKIFSDKFKNMPLSEIEDWYYFSENSDYVFVDKSYHNLDENSKAYQMLSRSKINGTIISPLRKEGRKIGSIVVGNPTANFDDIELAKLISGFIVSFIEKQDLINTLEDLSFSDSLTKLKNRHYFENEISKYRAKPPKTLGVLFCDVNGLKEANDNLGHEYGDILIKWAANFLTEYSKSMVFRIGGDEFVSFIVDKSYEEFYDIVNGINDYLSRLTYLNISVGHSWTDKDVDIDKQLVTADEKMYEVKQAYYEDRKYNHLNLQAHYNSIKKELEKLKELNKKYEE